MLEWLADLRRKKLTAVPFPETRETIVRYRVLKEDYRQDPAARWAKTTAQSLLRNLLMRRFC